VRLSFFTVENIKFLGYVIYSGTQEPVSEETAASIFRVEDLKMKAASTFQTNLTFEDRAL